MTTELRDENARLKAWIADLETRLNQSSWNSSCSPSLEGCDLRVDRKGMQGHPSAYRYPGCDPLILSLSISRMVHPWKTLTRLLWNSVKFMITLPYGLS
ncbi:DUF6444 domain-containing protein [Methanoculleus sp. 10]|uniref:DUF6444 domain-containing protein n=1 Tax=Methanoculleus sp. 10 TaxID=430615 RepID=UPI00341C618F